MNKALITYEQAKEILGTSDKTRCSVISSLQHYLVRLPDGNIGYYIAATTDCVLFKITPKGIIVDPPFKNAEVRKMLNETLPFYNLELESAMWFWHDAAGKRVAVFTSQDIIGYDGALFPQRTLGEVIIILEQRKKLIAYANRLLDAFPLKDYDYRNECLLCFTLRDPLCRGIFSTLPIPREHLRSHFERGDISPALVRNALMHNNISTYFNPMFSTNFAWKGEAREEALGAIKKYLIKAIE